MKTSILAALGLAALASAQATLPACAQSCVLDALGATGCDVTDAACICTKPAFLTGSQTCIEGACSAADQQMAAEYATSFCASAGVTLSYSSAAAPMTSMAPASSAAEETSMAAATTMMSETPAAATSEAAVTQISDGQPQAATSAAPATFSGAAMPMQKNMLGAIGGLALGVAAAL